MKMMHCNSETVKEVWIAWYYVAWFTIFRILIQFVFHSILTPSNTCVFLLSLLFILDCDVIYWLKARHIQKKTETRTSKTVDRKLSQDRARFMSTGKTNLKHVQLYAIIGSIFLRFILATNVLLHILLWNLKFESKIQNFKRRIY